MTIRELMDSGRLYAATNEGFPEQQLRCKELAYEFNQAHPRDEETRQKILHELLGDMGETVWIEPPFHLEFGYRTHIGSFFYVNFNLVIVDDVDVYIGDLCDDCPQRHHHCHRTPGASGSADPWGAVFLPGSY